MIRAFVALELPEPVRQALLDAIDGVRAAAPGKLAWTPGDNLHLTLAFLGGSEPERLALLADRLREIGSRHRAFPLELAGTGQFPHARRPSVLWVGVKPSPALMALQAEVADAARGLGWELESRPFAAHLTCARVKVPGPPGALAEAWAQARIGPVRWQVDALALMRSDTRPSGAVYTAMERRPLAPAP
jgi:2'-5' RNA ligase